MANKGGGGVLKLLLCASGVYACFLSWGVLQERISTSRYTSKSSGQEDKFPHFLFLNMTQSMVAMAAAFFAMFARNTGFGDISRPVLLRYLRIALVNSLASPFGYASLKYINFPVLVLGKACKLIPVMLMNWVVYRRKFEVYKYFCVAMVTVGVAGFMFFDPKASKGKGPASNSLFGILLLLINLMLDGATNSWQDKMFMKYSIRSQQMMFFMNLLSGSGMCLWIASPFNGELYVALSFVSDHPAIITDIMLFGLCGAIGQVFIFELLESFGSLTLVTVTVTRKLFTILISLFWFNHEVAPIQWIFVNLVFAGILGEAAFKGNNKKKVVTVVDSAKPKKD